MATFAFYLLKVILCSAILYGYYLLFLRNKIYHAYNRFYLLASVMVSMVAPLLNVQLLLHPNTKAAAPIQLLQVVNSSDEYLEEVIISSHRNYLSSSEMIAGFYILVSLVLLSILLQMFVGIFQLLKRNSSKNYQDIVFVDTEAKGTPFSFFKFIFWNRAINVHSATGQQILAHELAHVKEKHSVDKLCLNIVLVFYWINPIFWIIKKELNLIHEFIADKKAVANFDAASLAAMIVTAAYPTHSYLLTNHFFYSPIKRRLQMLTAYPSKKAGYFYRILALPVIVLLLAAFTIKTSVLKDNGIPNPTKKIRVMIDAGHGGHDGGAKSVDGILEKDLNLAIVNKIKALNNLSNVELVFTRETDIYQNPSEKVDITKANNPDLFVTVHIASGPSGNQNKASGMEVYVSLDKHANSQRSKLFASAVINHFKKVYDLPVAPLPKQREVSIFVLSGVDIPAILVHPGYINNSKDLAYLKSNKGQETIAINILKAISQYADQIPSKENSFTNGITQHLKTDTTPTTMAKVQYYKKEAIKSIQISNDRKTIYLTMADGNTESISMEEARLANINLPKDQREQSKVTFKNVDEYKEISADQFANQGRPVTPYSKTEDVMYVLNGTMVNAETVATLDKGLIESINVLKGDNAFEKYKIEKSRKGVIEIITKDPSKSIIADKKSQENVPLLQDDKRIFNKVEQEATFPGGTDAWKLFLRENIDPNLPVDEGKQPGTYKIMVRFIVNIDGTLTDIVAETYKDSKMATACVEMMKKSPKWIPAKQNGRTVNAYKRQPVTFVVSEE
jgi:N-acetylmuramoyl-L-alanine amidase